MKIAVYTIALNEEQFVKRWHESAKDADYLLIADTGSTDKTVATAKKLGINVFNISVKPWRFDDSRNAALALVPSDIDYCIILDMDEVLVEGWREKFEKTVQENPHTIYNCQLTWNQHEDGTPGLQYGTPRVHARQGFRWTHPIHEIITPYGDGHSRGWMDIDILHLADATKSRSSYLPLLEMAVKEDPNSDRNAFYYARELFYYKRYKEAEQEFKRHLSLPKAVWPPERAASMRHIAKCGIEDAESWFKLAIKESPGRREPIVELARYYYEKLDWENCKEQCLEALKIKEKPLDYFCEDFAWGYLPYDYLAISCYYLGDKKNALKYGKKALDLNKEDQRLVKNLEFYNR